MRTKTSIEIYNYWDQIRGADAGPLRSQIQPGAIRYLLPELFILEGDDLRQPAFRLAGTRICSLFGRELRNSPFSSLWPDGQDGDATTIAAGVMQHGIPALLNVTGFSRSGRSLRLEMVLLPVRSSGTTYDRILGSLTAETPISWLGAEPLDCITIDRSRLIGPGETAVNTGSLDPARTPKSLVVNRGGEFGEIMRRVLHLRIFEGGRVE